MAKKGSSKHKQERYKEQFSTTRQNKMRRLARHIKRNPNDQMASESHAIIVKVDPGKPTQGVCASVSAKYTALARKNGNRAARLKAAREHAATA